MSIMTAKERMAHCVELDKFVRYGCGIAARSPLLKGERPEWIDAAPANTVFHVSLGKWTPKDQGTALQCLFGCVFDDIPGHAVERNATIVNFAWGFIPPMPPQRRRKWPQWSCFVQMSRPPNHELQQVA